MKRARICVVTGTRAEFGIWQPVLRAILASRKLKLQLLVTGMHLLREFGHTVGDVVKEGFEVAARVPMYRRGKPAADSLARGIRGMAAAFEKLKPDLVMVLGDRMEIFAAAGAAMACQIPVAHVHGGETAPAQWDEQIRHAVTKMAQVHFCATEAAGRRILRMGENPEAVHVVGAPALDAIDAFIEAHPGFPIPHDPRAPILVVLHPSSRDVRLERARARLVLDALGGHPFSLVGPNNDPGHRSILQAYAELRVSFAMSLAQRDFWQNMTQASMLVGNSSAGIIEAASFGLPVINLGERQRGRERNTNVIDVPWEAGRKGIERAIQRVCTDSAFQANLARCQNLYGDGGAARRIIAVLESLDYPLSTVKSFYDR